LDGEACGALHDGVLQRLLPTPVVSFLLYLSFLSSLALLTVLGM
jgi:hypothetical protein